MKKAADKHGVCELEYAIELKELGEPQNSLWYWEEHFVIVQDKKRILDIQLVREKRYKHSSGVAYYSAYTVKELGERLPEYIKSGIYGHSRFIQTKNLKKTVIRYINFLVGDEEDCSQWETKIEIEADTEAKARAKCLIFLLKQGIIKSKELKNAQKRL